MAIGEQQHRIAMHLPEAAQADQRRGRQRYQAVFVALGIANMHPLPRGIDIGHRQTQAFAEAQSQAVKREKEYPVTESMGHREQPPGFLNGDNIRQALCPWRLDQLKWTLNNRIKKC